MTLPQLDTNFQDINENLAAAGNCMVHLMHITLIFSDASAFAGSRTATPTAANESHFESRCVLRQLPEDFARVFEVSVRPVAVFLGRILILRAGGDEIG